MLSSLRFTIFSLGFLVIPCGLSLTYTPFLWSVVHFCMPLLPMLLLVFLIFFLRSLNEVYRSSFTGHAMFFPIFIHQILLHLGLEDFPTSELVHIIAPIGATFLRQRVAQMRASSKRLRGEPFSVAPPPPPSSTGDATIEEPVDSTTNVPPPSTLDDSDI